MSKSGPGQEAAGRKQDSYKLELVGLAAGSERPKILVQALDRKNTALYSQEVGDDGNFAISADVLKRAHRVVIGAPDEKGSVRADASIGYRAEEFLTQIKNGRLALAESIWSRFHFHWTCVSGSVRVCRRRPWWFDSIISKASTVLTRKNILTNALVSRDISVSSSIERLSPSLNDLIYWPYRCYPICLGTVEVYRRTCCCWPIIIDDLRIPDLIRDLEIYVERLPKFPKPKPGFPPPPPPPVGDPLRTPFFKDGAMNELAINATNDLHMLRTLPSDQVAQYIQSRAYLLHRLCSCGQASKVATGTIQPDGTFNICWIEPWRLMLVNCYEQYAYVVKQTIGNTTTTIYNGLTAGAWFSAGETPVITSYNGNAYSCNETGTGDGDAYVFLDLIGDTESHELTTPDSTGWDRVAMPDATSGLLFPDAGPKGHLRNLGKAIELAFNFSLGMRDASIGAHYYRVSVCQADANGNPTGPRHYYGQANSDTLSWQKIVGPDIVLEKLGPAAPADIASGESYLYRIPYSDEPWVGTVRYHALIDTLQASLNGPTDIASPAVNHLITLEVFDPAGVRLRPLGTTASGQSGAEQVKPFKYRRWFQPGGSVGHDTAEVPYAALTHLFCWDNREPVADITRLVMNGDSSDEECQFLQGAGDSEFAIEYRAYVPDQRFQYRHDIGWLRGLNATGTNGGIGSLPTPSSPANAGKPPAFPVISGSDTFEHMLTRLDPPNPPAVLQRCAFKVTLTTFAKTTNGEDMTYPHAEETAAFALAID